MEKTDMSTDLTEDKPIGNMNVTSFYGGKERGKCLQFTISGSDGYGKYIQLDRGQVLDLFCLILKWLLA